jgi:hypothetical protein
MMGAADELAAKGIAVDAEVSRQMGTMLPVVEALRDAGRFGDAVVIHLGSNGPIDDATMTRFFTALADVPKVVVLTIDSRGDWDSANNAMIADLPTRFPNVSVLYWDGLAADCPGECFYDDGIHLRQDGQNYYANLIAGQLDL